MAGGIEERQLWEEEDDETTRLLGPPPGGRRRERKERRRTCLATSLLGIIFLTTAILASYFLFFKSVVSVRVMALNVWGMPAKVGSEDKELRIKAIGEYIAKAEFDVYLLAELWMRPDHATIEASLPEGYHMSAYGDYALATCDGRALPSFCSGLAIVSKFPFIEKQFHEYNFHGDILKPDGEYWARKGAGRARVEPYPGTIVDFFVTHTCAVGPNYSNAYYRTRQVKELVGWVNNSNADFVVLGGDFNTSPTDDESSYHDLKEAMVSSMEEFFRTVSEWLCPKRATYANPENTYSYMYEPVLYDYIWHRAHGRNMIWTNIFDVPFLKWKKFFGPENNQSTESKMMSFSDHEAVTSSLYLWRSIF